MKSSRQTRRTAQRHLARAVTETTANALECGTAIAAVMMLGKQPGRLFTTGEIETATDVAVLDVCERLRLEYAESGTPTVIAGAMVSAFSGLYRKEIRRGLCAALPASSIASEGMA